MGSNRSSELRIFTVLNFLIKDLEDREYSEDLLLPIGHSVSIHLLFAGLSALPLPNANTIVGIEVHLMICHD